MMNPTTFTELQVEKVHHGRVVYGMLCSVAFGISRVITSLEAGNGLDLRLSIYSTAVVYQADIERFNPGEPRRPSRNLV